MLEIFIEGNKLDINEEFSIMLSFAIDDIKDFAAKNTTFSKTVILPGTKNNNRLFGNIFDATISNNYDGTKKNVGINFNASVSASVVVFNNNIQIMKGILQLLEIIYDDSFIEYEVGLFGELAGFTAALGASLLSGNKNTDGTPNTALDLDFSSYNHNYTIANIVASKGNIGNGSGYIYPLMDYGTYGRNSAHTAAGKHSWIFQTFRPALFVKEYIDKIFSKAGYTYDCALFNTARFKGLVIPHNSKILQKASKSQLDIYVTDHTSNRFTADGSNNAIAIAGQNILGSFTPSAGNTIYTYTGTTQNGTITIPYSVNIDATALDSGANLALHLYHSGGGLPYATVIIGFMPSGTSGNLAGTATGSNITIASGDYLKLEAFGFDYSGTNPQFIVTIYGLGITYGSTGNLLVPINLGESVPLNEMIPPNILQKDFISSICKLFNLYIFEDPNQDKHLKIAPFVDFFHLSGSIDWAYKLDRSKPIKLKPMAELTARYYEFEYKKDSDYWNELYEKRYNITYGSYKYDSNYQLSKESQKIEIIFSGTPIVGYQGQDKVYSTIFKRTGTDSVPVEETVDSNIRILQTKLVTGVTSWDILDAVGTTVLGSYTDYPYAGHFDNPDTPSNDINFGVPLQLFFTLLAGSININQFNLYWSSYLAEITDKDAKLLTATFKLAFKDINGLDFSKYIYLDGSLWRLNKILDLNATQEDTCTCELIKVSNKIY